jgi:hypothetical protein
MSKRTDIHRPSAIQPEDYDFVCFEYYGSADLDAIMAMQSQREIRRAHEARTGGTRAKHENSGSCHVCGAHASYIVVWHNRVTNQYIHTGEDCAEKMDRSYGDISAFRTALKHALELHAGKRKAEAVLESHGLQRAWTLYTAESTQTFQREESIIVNIVGKLVKYGNVSEPQVKFIHSLLGAIDNRAAENAAAAPVPSGRVVIEGVVLSVKVTEDQFGSHTKILVRDNTGFKVWGSRFSINGFDGGVQKDDQVKFTATVEPSSDDPKFGFFKRPVAVLPKLSKEDKKATNKLKRIRKALGYSKETIQASNIMSHLIRLIQFPGDEYATRQLREWKS